MTKLIAVDGMKAVTLWGDEGWTALSGYQEVADTEPFLAARVPVVFRGREIIANAVASIPFDVVDEAGNVVDTSSDWKNEVGFLPDPSRLFWEVSHNWTTCGRAYIYRSDNGNYIKHFFHLSPSSVTYDPKNNLERPFIRTVDGSQLRYGWAIDKDGNANKGEAIVALWRPDGDVELGPPLSYPAKAAFSAMGVLYNLDNSATRFFQRGMMGITIFSVPNGTQQETKDKLESKINNMLTGVRQAWRSLWINGELKPITVGGGLSELANVPLTEQEWTNVSMALGVPMTKLRSESATGLGGGGVAQTDDVRLILDTALPEFERIIAELNKQVFSPMGYRIVERHERMSIFQQSEASRMSALTSLVSAFSSDPKLAAILAKLSGIEIPEETLAELDALSSPQEQPAARAVWADDWARWERKALKAIGKPVNFDSDLIPDDLHARVSSDLLSCKTAEDVRRVFHPEQARPDLANELRRANDLLERVAK